MAGIKKSITELIGDTPLVELVQYEERNNLDAAIYAKLEYFSPTNSVKDRIALAMIEDAEKSGALKPGDVVIETTSGNTGNGVAAIAAVKGYKVRIYMQDGVSEERTKAVKAYGAEIIKFTDIPELKKVLEETNNDFVAFIKELRILLEKEGKKYVFINQIANPENPNAHYRTTGPEIWRDTEGDVDILVVCVGTGGTVSGAGKYLKEKNPNIKIVAVQPGPNSIPDPENPHPKEITGVHPFINVPESRIPDTFDRNIYDEAFEVETPQAYETAREVAKSDGILVGTSSGAALYAATQLAKRPENKGKKIVAVFADTGLKYLSTDLFEI